MSSNTFYSRMNHVGNKSDMITIAGQHHRILDIGAGDGYIDHCISFFPNVEDIYAVEQSPAAYQIFKERENPTGKIKFFNLDVENFLKIYKQRSKLKFDCVILSAVIHEMNTNQLNHLKSLLRGIIASQCTILIREPLITSTGPWINQNRGLIYLDHCISFNSEEWKEWSAASKLSSEPIREDINLLNYAFTRAYGPDSWSREVHQHRFAYTYDFVVKWAKGFFKRAGVKKEYLTYKDDTYFDHFCNAGLNPFILDCLWYTSGLLVLTNIPRIKKLNTINKNNSIDMAR